MFQTHQEQSLENITSIDQCRAMANGFRALAELADARAREIENHRQNFRKMLDKKDLLWAAQRVLDFDLNGGDTASECRKLSERLWLKYEHIWRVYEMKKTAHEENERSIRNDKMMKWHESGLTYGQISRRTELSKGRVSQIIRSLK